MSGKNRMAKEVSLLGLDSEEMPSSSNDQLSLSSNHEFSRDERRINDEYNKQTLVIRGIQLKTILGDRAISEIRVLTSLVFQDTVVAVFEHQNQVRGTECEAYVAEFNRANLQGCARGLLSAAGMGESAISHEVGRPLYPEPESFWSRLFSK